MREETFGPVCSFIGYRSEEEALARINASPYGLAASVWSDNIRQALRYSEAIDAGIVWSICIPSSTRRYRSAA